MSAADEKIVAFLFPGGRRQSSAAVAIDHVDFLDHEGGEAPQLALGDRARVVELPKAKRPPAQVVPRTSEAFNRAWAAFPEVGRRRSSRGMSWPQWVRVAAAIGEAQLLGAVEAYARDPVELTKEGGAPGFERWLRWNRWEHWIGADFSAGQITPTIAAWTGPPEMWEAACVRYGEPWARSWLAGSTWDQDRATLLARDGFTAERLARDLRTEFACLGVRRIVAVKEGREVGRAHVLPNPQPIPERLADSFAETFTADAPRDWLALCSWDRATSTIISPRDLKPEWSAGPLRRWMDANGVAGWRRL